MNFHSLAGTNLATTEPLGLPRSAVRLSAAEGVTTFTHCHPEQSEGSLKAKTTVPLCKEGQRSGGSFTFEPAKQSPTLAALVACENEFSLTRWHKL